MRIAIVNDTLMSVIALRRIIENSGEHTVAWVAHDGKEAVEICANDIPDLILMDIIMPEMDGVEATREIMLHSPCAILLVTSTVTGNASKVFEAMGAGALDAINTPILESADESNMGEDLLKKINVIRKLIKIGIDKPERIEESEKKEIPADKIELIAIGSSTGGPSALVSVLNEIPKDFPAAFIIVQHVDKQFIDGFISWLGDQISLPVRKARNGDKIETGVVLVADSEQHLVLTKNQKLNYTIEPEDYPYKPSVNVFFSSLAQHWQNNAMGILLTGMGRDGAEGLLAMKEKGFFTIAQEESSCAVFGMPKAAINLKAAKLVLTPLEINANIVHSFINKNDLTKNNKKMGI